MTEKVLIDVSHLILPLRLKITKDFVAKCLLTGSFFEMHLSACMMRRMISTVVSIQIHLDYPSSHTNSYSISSLTKMLIAYMRETDLSMDDMEELMGMQS